MKPNNRTQTHWSTTGAQPRIAIIGAGVSGIAAVVLLNKAGYNDVTVYEKADRVGGTWRDNQYPGLSCDVPSYWYQFTFAHNSQWSHRFSYGPEIQSYLEKVADDFGVNKVSRFNDAVSEIRYVAPQWHLTTAAGEQQVYDIVISATGILQQPKMPDIPGLDSFAGEKFHSARWNHDAAIKDARVGVLGTGSTASQVVGAIGESTKKLSVFQRTPQWNLPMWQRKHPEWWKKLLARRPILQRGLYRGTAKIADHMFGPATVKGGFWQQVIEHLCKRNLNKTVKDPELKAKLTPTYDACCKRLVLCSTFYQSIVRENVELVTDHIEAVEPRGIRSKDGRLHELDTLVLCSGFHANRFLLPTKVVGENGIELADVWGEAPRAHRTVSVPGFPNLWFVEGPTGPIGNISLVAVSELQVNYIIQCLDRMKADGLASINATQPAYDASNKELAAAAKTTTWATGGCDSWYIDKTGTPNLYPWHPSIFYKEMQQPDFSEYQLSQESVSSA